jgi:hypothetical protein
MPSLPKEISEFMATYSVNADEVWPVPGGKAYAVKHKALERIANEAGIKFDRPSVIACDLERRSMVICTFANLGDKTEWSFGEAAPENCKNNYIAAMAEKRSRDRVILKLLSAHGALYSEEEAEEFKQHETVSGEFVPNEDVIKREDGIQVLTMDAQRPIFTELEKEIGNNDTVEELKRWKVTARKRASRLSDHWRKDLEAHYLKRLRELEQRDALEYQERMTG